MLSQSQKNAWEEEYQNPKFLSLDTEPQADILRFFQWIKNWIQENSSRNLLSENSCMLDLGTGTGRNLNYFVDHYGGSGIGYDISPTALKLAKISAENKGIDPSRVHYELQSISDPYTNIADNSIDLVCDVTSSNSLYRGERDLYLKEVYRVLKDDGVFFVRTLCRDGDANAQRLLKLFPGVEEGSYILPETDIMEHVYEEKDFRKTYGTYFDILFFQKKTGYQRWGSQSFKRRYIIVYLRKKLHTA